MIDELVRDALDAQVGPPPSAATWARVDRAAGLARRRRGRRLAATLTAVLVLALAAGAVAARGGTHELRVSTKPTAPPAASPSVPVQAVHLSPRSSWEVPSNMAIAGVSFDTARAANDGHDLLVFGSGGGVCDQPVTFTASETGSSVKVDLWRLDQGQISCPPAFPTTFVLRLPTALGTRKIVDGSTGHRVRLLDTAPLLVPRTLPERWIAETEDLSDTGTWSRCYGSCNGTRGPEVTTAQGPDLNDVLHAGLGKVDDVGPGNLTFVPNLSLARQPFAYGVDSELQGQLIPARDKLTVDVNGHDGVLITSWANLIVLWRDGSTWHAVMTSRDRRTTDGPQVGIGSEKLLAFARSLAPAG
ncbi:MAG TPA: hypothetical protein VMU14_12045 [Acidimicrobiales bacterium]|nr:hypothetical protein [Acidimicrobiales bacterium]